MLLLIGVVLAAILISYMYLKRFYSRSSNDPPGPEPHIFLGNLLSSGLLMGKTTLHEVMMDYQRRYGDKFLFWFGPHPLAVFCLPEHAKTIFSDRHTFEQSPLAFPNFDLLCPHNIFLLRGPKWKRHIRVMLPMFKRAKIIHYLNAIVECTDRFIDRHLNDNQIHRDLKIHFQSLVMNVVGLIAFNYDFDTAADPSIKKALGNFSFEASLMMMNSWIPRWLLKLYLKLNSKYQQSNQRIREVGEKIVKHEQDNQNVTENDRPKNLIASLVSSLNEQANDEQTSSGLTQAEMFDEILSLILAGYETTSAALSWFIFYMSKYPHVQERIKDELREHNLLMADDVGSLPPLSVEKLDSLIYCECVVKEVLRLASVVGLTTRIALHDTVIDNVPIRSGQTVVIAIQNINTDARYWHHADPNEFVPERFLGKDKDHHPYAMIPFGGGHRACIGQELAWFELKVIIVRLMQRSVTFEDTAENTGGYEEHLTCSPKNLIVRARINQQ